MKTGKHEIREHVVLCLALCIVLAGYALLGILPLYGVSQNLQQKAMAQDSRIGRAQRLEAELAPMRQRIASLESQVGDYSAKVPQDRKVGDFLQQIAGLMREHGLSEQAVRPGSERAGSRLNRIPVTMESHGNLEQIFEFLRSLQALDRVVRIEKVELTSSDYADGRVRMWADTSIFYKS